jgi:hypothetical protein
LAIKIFENITIEVKWMKKECLLGKEYRLTSANLRNGAVSRKKIDA